AHGTVRSPVAPCMVGGGVWDLTWSPNAAAVPILATDDRVVTAFIRFATSCSTPGRFGRKPPYGAPPTIPGARDPPAPREPRRSRSGAVHAQASWALRDGHELDHVDVDVRGLRRGPQHRLGDVVRRERLSALVHLGGPFGVPAQAHGRELGPAHEAGLDAGHAHDRAL